MIYFTSDLHFGHRNMALKRHFSSAEEMDAVLTENWNRCVRSDDEIYILGDFTMQGAAFAMEKLHRLNGRKYLVRGNHDIFADKTAFDRSLLKWIKDYHSLSYQKQRFVLMHYPIEEWDGFFRGTIHLHGHQHNGPEQNAENLRNSLRRYDVGVDANGMTPVSMERILAFFEKEER